MIAEPVECKNVHGGDATMRVSGDVVSRSNHQRVCARVERFGWFTCLEVTIPADALYGLQVAFRYGEHPGESSLAGTAAPVGP